MMCIMGFLSDLCADERGRSEVRDCAALERVSCAIEENSTETPSAPRTGGLRAPCAPRRCVKENTTKTLIKPSESFAAFGADPSLSRLETSLEGVTFNR